MDKGKISVVINTYNASSFLEKTLKYLEGFDEVVICDMESTDNTKVIAEQHGCKFVTFPKGNISICEPARNFAIQSASNQWVLVVDADEIVTPELREYLYNEIKESTCPDGLYIPRKNMFMGKYIHSSPDYQLRFFRRDKADWPPIIHRPPVIDGVIKNIPSNLDNVCFMHLDDACLYDRLRKLNSYTEYEVLKRKNKHYGGLSLLFRPLWFFLRCYFIQGAIRDGVRGIIRSYMAAWYQVIMLAKIKEYKWKNEQVNIQDK